MALKEPEDCTTIEELLEEFGDPFYTVEQFIPEWFRLRTLIATKHGIDVSEVDTLIGEHRYDHEWDSPEDEYLELMSFARAAGWTI